MAISLRSLRSLTLPSLLILLAGNVLAGPALAEHAAGNAAKHNKQRVKLDFHDRYFWQREAINLEQLVRQQHPRVDLGQWRVAKVRAQALSPGGHGRLAVRGHQGRLAAATVPMPGKGLHPFHPVVLDLPRGRRLAGQQHLALAVGRDVVLDRVVLVLEPRRNQARGHDTPRHQPNVRTGKRQHRQHHQVAWQDLTMVRSHDRKTRDRLLNLPNSKALRLTGHKRALRVEQAWVHLGNGNRKRVPSLEGVLQPGQQRYWQGQYSAGRLVLTLSPEHRNKRGYLTVATG